MKLVGELYIYEGQYGYQTLLKNNDDKLYVQVGFKKNQEPNIEKGKIDIKDGFLSFYKTKDGLAKPKIVVLDYTELETVQENNYQDPFNPTDTSNDDMLPF